MALKPLVPADLTSMMEAGYSPAQQRAAGLNVGSPYGDQTFIQPVMIPVPEKSGVASLQDIFEQKRDVYRGILGDPEEQRRASQSQALFTIANFGLQLAGATGGRVGASFGEKLAQAAQGSQLFPSISAISQQQREAQQKFDLAALQAAETERAAALKAEADLRAKDAKSPSLKNLVGPDKTTVLFSFNENDPSQYAKAERIKDQNKGSFYGTPGSSSSDSMKEFVAIAPVTVRGVEVPVGGRISLTSEEIKGISPNKIELFRPEKHGGATTQFKALENIPAGTIPGVKVSLAEGQIVQLTPTQVSAAPTLLERYTSETELASAYRNLILPGGKILKVVQKGVELFDIEGKPLELTPSELAGSAFVSDDKAFELGRLVEEQEAAGARADILEVQNLLENPSAAFKEAVKTYTDATGKEQTELTTGELVAQVLPNLRPEDRAQYVSNAVEAVRKGVGFFPKLNRVISDVGGAVFEGLQEYAIDEVEAGQYINTLNVLVRVGLAQSPRFAEAEQERLANLVPTADNFFTNPRAALSQLAIVKRELQRRQVELYNALKTESDSTIRRELKGRLRATESALSMVIDVPTAGFGTQKDIDSISREIREGGGVRVKQ